MADSAKGWTVDESLAERGRFKEYNRKHPREFAACLVNLKLLTDLLGIAPGIQAVKVGFFRSEGEGVYRIGQTGVKHAHETRLYIHVNETTKTLRVLTIGDKDTQSDDIRHCHQIARKLKAGG